MFREEQIAAFDAAHPLPPPKPLCGQVWTDISDGEAVMVVLVCNEGVQTSDGRILGYEEWPPPPHTRCSGPWVLVYGPGSPWAPMGDDRPCRRPPPAGESHADR